MGAVEENLDEELALAEPPPLPAGKPWGFWATFGFSALAVCAYMIVGNVAIACVLAIGLVSSHQLGTSADLFHYPEQDWVQCISYDLSCSTVIALVALFVRFRSRQHIAEYLALRIVPKDILGTWSAVALILAVAYVVACILLGQSIGVAPDPSATGLVFYRWFVAGTNAVIFPAAVCALFLGFMYRGFTASRLGLYPGAALALTAYTAGNFASSLFDGIACLVFMAAVFFARIRTGSILVPFAMMAVAATVDMAVAIVTQLRI